MSEFSKGKWRYDMLPLTADKNIQITIPSKVIALVITRNCSEEESIANARLIAEAPTMYDLLDSALYLLEKNNNYDEICRDINDCLSRVDGVFTQSKKGD